MANLPPKPDFEEHGRYSPDRRYHSPHPAPMAFERYPHHRRDDRDYRDGRDDVYMPKSPTRSRNMDTYRVADSYVASYGARDDRDSHSNRDKQERLWATTLRDGNREREREGASWDRDRQTEYGRRSAHEGQRPWEVEGPSRGQPRRHQDDSQSYKRGRRSSVTPPPQRSFADSRNSPSQYIRSRSHSRKRSPFSKRRSRSPSHARRPPSRGSPKSKLGNHTISDHPPPTRSRSPSRNLSGRENRPDLRRSPDRPSRGRMFAERDTSRGTSSWKSKERSPSTKEDRIPHERVLEKKRSNSSGRKPQTSPTPPKCEMLESANRPGDGSEVPVKPDEAILNDAKESEMPSTADADGDVKMEEPPSPNAPNPPITLQTRSPPTGPRVRAQPPTSPRSHLRSPHQNSAHAALPSWQRSTQTPKLPATRPLPEIPVYVRPLSPPSLTPELDAEVARLEAHRLKLVDDHYNVVKAVRRAAHELELAAIDLRAAEQRRRVADMQMEQARVGMLGIDAVSKI